MDLARDAHTELIIAGTTRGVAGTRVQLVVVLEPVVPDDVASELIALDAAEVVADGRGRFLYRYSPPDEVRARLTGWIMCTVMAQRMTPGATTRTTVVRWQRPSSAALIAGLNALLGTITLDAGARVRGDRSSVSPPPIRTVVKRADDRGRRPPECRR